MNENVSRWHVELGEAWRSVQVLLFRAGITEQERRDIEIALARIEAVRREMRVET